MKTYLLLISCLVVGTACVRAAVTDGLAAHYKFDEASGTAAADAIRGPAGAAALSNFGATPWGAGKVGGAITTDGVNDWLSTPAAIPSGATAMSFSGWVWADSRPTWASIAKNWGDAAGQFHLGLDSTSGRLSNYLTDGTKVVDPTVFPTVSWQHVAFTYDGTTHCLYRNGALVASKVTTTPLTRLNEIVALGCKTTNAGTAPNSAAAGFWKGKFDDFGFWNRALTAAEITEIYNDGQQGFGLGQHAAPVIATFAANPANVAVGGGTVLSWSVANATVLSLTGGEFADRDVTGLSSIATGPLAADTTFTLAATNTTGTSRASCLVGRLAALQEPVISEFLAANDTGLQNPDPGGGPEDWIEIHNPNAAYSLDLAGYHLTDSAGNLAKWTFPAVTLPPDGYLVVFASELDRAIPGQPLHTNFKLSASGEYLALVKPDGVTVVQQFAPAYPPQQADLSYGAAGNLASPTPGAANTALAGPLITAVTDNPPPPAAGDAVPISATLTPQNGATVTAATLIYRVMYGAEVSLPMVAGANGGYTALIPAAATPGQMLRWRITSTDSLGRSSRAPLFRDPTNSPEYFGTVVQDAAVVSTLPVIRRFVQTPAGIDNDPGTRCSIYFNGEFLDNVGIRVRGLTSRSFPKKSHKLELNSGHRLQFETGGPRVTEFDLNTTYTDKSYVRAILASEMQRACGMVSPEVFPVEVRQNNTFYSVALFVENPDTDYLVRHDLDPDGAYYKAPSDNTYTTSATFEKKTRLYEAGKADLDALIANLSLTGTALETYVFDNVDLPGMINYIATTCITQNIDASDKNHFVYRDTNGSGEWVMLPWDLDLTFGPNALNTDTIVYNQNYASHPFIGASPYLLGAGKNNRFLEAIINTPRSRNMVIRRIRSLTDSWLATHAFQSRIDQLVPLLDPEVTVDHATWGAASHFGGLTHTLQAAIDRIKAEYLAPRQTWLDGGGSVGIPASAPPAPVIHFGGFDANPASGNQAQEFVELRNPNAYAVDLSGWTIAGGISHTVKSGTVLLGGESLYLTPSAAAFRGRTTGPQGGQRLFVQGGVSGHLSNFGETLTLRNSAGTVISSLTVPADPSPAQRFLVISEVMYHPAPNGDAEFIELINTSPSATLDLTGVKFTAGVDFTFPALSLPPLARLLVVKNTAAFESVHGPGLPIAGTFANLSSLSNGGERLKLDDANGSTICEFTYSDAAPWPVAADGSGSLVLIAPLTHPDPALPENWRASMTSTGNPAADDAVHFAGDPNGDADHDGWSNLLEYALGDHPQLTRSAATPGFTVAIVPNADDALILGEASADLKTWTPAELTGSTGTSRTFRPPAGLATEPRVFMRAVVKLRP